MSFWQQNYREGDQVEVRPEGEWLEGVVEAFTPALDFPVPVRMTKTRRRRLISKEGKIRHRN